MNIQSMIPSFIVLAVQMLLCPTSLPNTLSLGSISIVVLSIPVLVFPTFSQQRLRHDRVFALLIDHFKLKYSIIMLARNIHLDIGTSYHSHLKLTKPELLCSLANCSECMAI